MATSSVKQMQQHKATLIEPRFVLKQADWRRFADHVTANYPLPSFSQDEREFVRKALLPNGQCTDDNKLWVNIFADYLLEHVDENVFDSAHPVSENLHQLSMATCQAILSFFNIQHALRLQVPRDLRTPEQHRMLEIHPNIMNFPMQLVIDMGRLLHLQKMATRHPAGESRLHTEERYLFEKLHNQLEEAARMQMQQTQQQSPSMGVPKAVSEDPYQQRTGPLDTTASQGTVEWQPRSAEDSFLRLCTFKVWCDKYEHEEEWSPIKMVNEWLQEAIDLYNHISYHWPQCHVKKWPQECFHDIRLTCVSWLHSVGSHVGPVPKHTKPSTNWVTDWCTPPVHERRQEWESYFCSVILQAKHLARLMGKHEVIPHEILTSPTAQQGKSMETPETEGPPIKKARMEEGVDTASALEDMVRRVVREEMQHVDKRLSVLDRHGLERHYDAMREMGGHITPLRRQVYELTSHVNFMHGTLDRLQPASTR